jgi:hypothetical protein
MPTDEKFPLEEVERLKGLARVEETFPAADECADCLAARAKSGDPTDLCPAHLKRVLGV